MRAILKIEWATVTYQMQQTIDICGEAAILRQRSVLEKVSKKLTRSRLTAIEVGNQFWSVFETQP